MGPMSPWGVLDVTGRSTPSIARAPNKSHGSAWGFARSGPEWARAGNAGWSAVGWSTVDQARALGRGEAHEPLGLADHHREQQEREDRVALVRDAVDQERPDHQRERRGDRRERPDCVGLAPGESARTGDEGECE